MKKKINLILTGGTIGSSENEKNIINTNSKAAANTLIDELYKIKPSYRNEIEFDISQPVDLLSENLSLSHWNDMINHLKAIDIESPDGIIITHGTDTLAFTANLMALLFMGTDIPVFIVASSKPLTNSNANGYDNFKTAVELLFKGVKSDVYVPYKNSNGEMNIHSADKLIQCTDLSSDFYSAHHKLNNLLKIRASLNYDNPILFELQKLKANILTIAPHPGLDYRNFNIDNIDAVLHRTYHSSTAAVKTQNDNDDYYSIFTLQKRCEEKSIPLYVTPLLSGSKQVYSTTDAMINRGIIPLYDMTFEMSYIYLILKYSL